MGKINDLVKAAHNNAITKGWWEDDRTFGEIIALIHSELSEALEDYRNGRQPSDQWYTWNGNDSFVSEKQVDKTWKPCGIPSELADVVIRIFDVCGRSDWGALLEESVDNYYDSGEVPECVSKERPFAENISIIHGWLTEAFRSDTASLKIAYLALAVFDTKRLSEFYDIDLDTIIAEKMAYNATRPHKHGGKVI